MEGAETLFTVWTDHKNLAYIQTAKRLNSRQARLALFFGRFNFNLTYRPGSKNIKPDALSRQFCPDSDRSLSSDTIIPKACLVGSLTWDIESVVKTALQNDPGPGGGPPGCLFVPVSVHSQVLKWGHTSRFTCHPGVSRTLLFLRRHFWWPSMATDTRKYVRACTICAQGKTTHRPPAGLLHPLPVPGRPWSHIALDFMTGLWTDFLKLCILWLLRSYLPLQRLQSCWSTMFSGPMVFPWTSSPTGVLSSPPKYGRSFAWRWEPPSVCPPVIIPSLTARHKGPTKTWKPLGDVFVLTTLHLGARTSPGSNTLITP